MKTFNAEQLEKHLREAFDGLYFKREESTIPVVLPDDCMLFIKVSVDYEVVWKDERQEIDNFEVSFLDVTFWESDEMDIPARLTDDAKELVETFIYENLE